MVQPPEERKIMFRTLEQRLADKFDDLQVARENRNIESAGVIFDEIARSIEVLLRGKPEAYNELMGYKHIMDEELNREKAEIQQEAGYARNEIQRDAQINQGFTKANWDYREVYEQVVIDVMQRHNLIDMRTPPEVDIIPAQTQQEPPVEVEEQPQEQEELQTPEPEPAPQPVDKKANMMDKIRRIRPGK